MKSRVVECRMCAAPFTAARANIVFCTESCGSEWRARRARPMGSRRRVDRAGYVWIGNQLEHRLVMERVLGRKLRRDEDVHHRNEDRSDNRPTNLELRSHREHAALHHAIRREARITAGDATARQRKVYRRLGGPGSLPRRAAEC